jgi:hypothetical protein
MSNRASSPLRALVTEVVVQGPLGRGRVRCEVEAAEPWSAWLGFWPWVSWPALVILLFTVHQFLVGRRSRCPADTKDVAPLSPGGQGGPRAAAGLPGRNGCVTMIGAYPEQGGR